MQLISFFYSNLIKCNIKEFLFIAHSFQKLCGEYGLRKALKTSYAHMGDVPQKYVPYLTNIE